MDRNAIYQRPSAFGRWSFCPPYPLCFGPPFVTNHIPPFSAYTHSNYWFRLLIIQTRLTIHKKAYKCTVLPSTMPHCTYPWPLDQYRYFGVEASVSIVKFMIVADVRGWIAIEGWSGVSKLSNGYWSLIEVWRGCLLIYSRLLHGQSCFSSTTDTSYDFILHSLQLDS